MPLNEGVLVSFQQIERTSNFFCALLSFPCFLFSSKPMFRENMLGFTAASLQAPMPISIPSISRPLLSVLLINNCKIPSSTLKFQAQRNSRKPRKFVVCAVNGNGQNTDPEEEREKKRDDGNNGGGEDMKRNGRPTFNLRWFDLLLDPNPDNILAVGLTGLLAWASVQVLWQLFFISLAIVVAALKYSFIAALLLFILITLL